MYIDEISLRTEYFRVVIVRLHVRKESTSTTWYVGNIQNANKYNHNKQATARKSDKLSSDLMNR